MNLYLVFAGDVYYPNGGTHDLVGTFRDLEAARAKAAEMGDADDTPPINRSRWTEVAVVKDDGSVTEIEDDA